MGHKNKFLIVIVLIIILLIGIPVVLWLDFPLHVDNTLQSNTPVANNNSESAAENNGIKKVDVTKLDRVQVREYQGEKLDSTINGFRENSIKGVQHIDISDYRLEVFGLTSNPKNYTYEDVIGKDNYEKVITLNCVEGWSATILWRGILVRDILDEVNPTEEANTVIFYAYDGYTTSFPLGYFYDKDIIMAYAMNNVTIIPERGYPFQLVAEDRWGYKWIKWITKIELSDDSEYEGYWESRGYSDGGYLNESFFD